MKSDLDKLRESLRRIEPILEGLTIDETANFLGISSSSVDKALQFVRKNASLLPQIDSSINPEEFITEIASILRSNTIKGKKAAGHSGGKIATWTNEEALRIAHLFLANGFTLRKAAPVLGYSKSSLLEIFNSDSITQDTDLYKDIRKLLNTNLALRTVQMNASLIEEYNTLEQTKHQLMEKYAGISKEKGYLGERR